MFTNLTDVGGIKGMQTVVAWTQLASSSNDTYIITCDGSVGVVVGVITTRTISRTSTMTACHAQLALHTRILSSPHQSAAVYLLCEHFTLHVTLPGRIADLTFIFMYVQYCLITTLSFHVSISPKLSLRN